MRKRKIVRQILLSLTCGLALVNLAVAEPGNNHPANHPGYTNRPATTFSNEQDAIKEIARQVIAELRNNAVRTIFVRHFRGPGTNDLQLTNLLLQELDDQFEIGPGGVEIEGRVRHLDGSDDGPPLGYRINVNLEGPDDSITFQGASVDVINDMEAHLKLNETEATRPQPPRQTGQPFQDVTTLKPAISDLIQGTRILPHPNSPYSLEILVQDADGTFAPRTPFVENGALVVNLERGETYKVRVYNQSGYESFAKLTIDGLGRFSLSNDPAQRRNIDLINSGSSRDLIGYYLNPQQAASFVVGEYEESVAKRILGDAPDIGTISVAFGCTYTGAKPAHEHETKTVYQQKSTTVMVPQVITVPRTITENVPVIDAGPGGAPVGPAGGPTPAKKSYRGNSEIPTSDQPGTGTPRGSGPAGPGSDVQTRSRTVYEQKTILVPQQQTRMIQESRVVGTTEGPAVGDNVNTVRRNFGLTRAVVKVRYYATR